MWPINHSCSTEFLPAYHDSGQRGIADVRWIVLHDEEAPTARSAAEYFQNPQSGGSAHLCVDDQECYRCLSNETIPWGAASSFGANKHGFHIEQAGYAKWSAVVWKSHLGTLQRAAYKTAFHCKLLEVPTVWVPAADLLKDVHGVTTHAEVSKASKIQDPANWRDYTHTDPGPFWPRIMFMYLVRRYFKAL